MNSTVQEMVDFFISYNHKDEEMAEWIAWILEAAGYSTFIQAWDFKSGNNFILQMDKGASNSKHTLALLSSNYMESLYTQPEWSAAFVKDPTGENQKLIPVRIEDINLNGLFPSIIYIDLVNKDENSARDAILNGIKTERKKPKIAPSFPGIIQKSSQQMVLPSKNLYEEIFLDEVEIDKTKLESNFISMKAISGCVFSKEQLEKSIYEFFELEYKEQNVFFKLMKTLAKENELNVPKVAKKIQDDLLILESLKELEFLYWDYDFELLVDDDFGLTDYNNNILVTSKKKYNWSLGANGKIMYEIYMHLEYIQKFKDFSSELRIQFLDASN
ncbi:toll/interleukin-1 receptor domain-containing protein [Bacillus thuringiensis]|uniref:toll/interleukin-1 receptor domain-containing protein n=1 Tax=Bacillus thuringiensis TaxID=1428 RepID=UPI000BF2CC5A|nr:toll/interleukin-1 receptor domain-containing protein [Bacillus thuringiensis]PFJ58616.1 hypothetical protein COJ10_24495 [Bacillus thuringiensis]